MQNWQNDIEKAQKGDLNAFDNVVRRFRDMAVGYAYSILGDFQLAEDAAQEAFIQAYQDLRSLNAFKAFPSWFRRIVFKYCDRQIRKKQHPTVPIETANNFANHSDSPSEIIDNKDTKDAVLHNVNSLPPNERTAIALFYINGYSMSEIGRFLEVPVSTVKSRLHSARTKLKERIIKMAEESLKSNTPGEDFNNRIRHILKKVPVISFELHRKKRAIKGLRRCPEIVPFPSCLRACLEFLKDDMGYKKINIHNRDWRLDTSYVYLMGTTGSAFRLSWKPGWQPDNSVISHISEDADEPFKRGLQSVGYQHEIVHKNKSQNNEKYFRRKIIESIRDKNRPVIARGVLGPPEECIVAGFDEEGDILIGWSFFQSPKKFYEDVEFEANGYFRKRNWFKDTICLFLLGDKKERPPFSETYRDSIQWALKVIRTKWINDRYNGIAAYDAIAKEIRQDKQFLNKKVKELHQSYLVLQDALGPIGEGRWYAHNFINKIIEDVNCPKQELSRAAKCFSDEHSLMWKMWELVGGPGTSTKKAKLFADKNIRKKTAQIIIKARDKNSKGADYLENALKIW